MHAGSAGRDTGPFHIGRMSAPRLFLERPWRLVALRLLFRRLVRPDAGGNHCAGSAGVKRGGFGAFAHSFSSHVSFGG